MQKISAPAHFLPQKKWHRKTPKFGVKTPKISETNSVSAKLGRTYSHDLRVFAALGTI